MKLTADDYEAAEAWVLTHSLQVRVFGKRARYLISYGLRRMQREEHWNAATLRKALEAEAKRKYALNPWILWLLLKIIPIIVKLLLRWWNQREKEPRKRGWIP